MVFVARLALGIQNEAGISSDKGHILGLSALPPYFTDYIVGMALLGPPMLVAFIIQWMRHGQRDETASTWVVLGAAFALWGL